VIKPETPGIPLINQQLSLSVSGEDYFLKMGRTDENGIFYFSVDENLNEADAIIQLIGNNRDKYSIEIEKPEVEIIDLKDLRFADFGITASMEQNIIDRSIHNQIENAYFSLKPDTITSVKPTNIFTGVDKVVYQLDDYTRFKTLQETFVEIIPYARIRKNQNKFEFSVLGYEPNLNFEGIPLVIVDGLPVQEVDDFVKNYDSRKIDNIKIIRSKYYLGLNTYKGVILIETLNNDFNENYQYEYLKEMKISSGVPHKQYFKQDYSQKRSPEIPDFRTQLLWDPDLKISMKNSDLSFYTSDVTGNFEIIIQGFQNDGKPISIRKTFTVK